MRAIGSALVAQGLSVERPLITPGYWRDPALTAEAFDAEGIYKLGDALGERADLVAALYGTGAQVILAHPA